MRGLTSVDRAEERSIAADQFEREASRSRLYRVDAKSRLKLRWCSDLYQRLLLDIGKEQMEINKQPIDKMGAWSNGPDYAIGEHGCRSN